MAIRDILWACPLCGERGALVTARRIERCRSCQTSYQRGRGAEIVATTGAGRTDARRAPDWIGTLPALPPAPGERGRPERAILRTAGPPQPVIHQGALIGFKERFGPRVAGSFRLDMARIEFTSDDGHIRQWPLEEVTAVQPSSSALQIKARGRPVVSIRFTEGSVLLWEHWIQQALRCRLRALGRGEVIDFQPHVVVAGEAAPGGAGARRRPDRPAAAGAAGHSDPPEPFYRFFQWVPRALWKTFSQLRVDGLENVPDRGPFILVSNHQSNLDPILLQATCPRVLYAMAKSTQYAVPVAGALMTRLHAFPVRRYQTDPQSVRMTLRLLREGRAVHIYPEGERTWDGRLQLPRPGTLRILLRAGVPVIPATIAGAYDAWPRWAGRPQALPIRIAFGPPMRFPHLLRKLDREIALATTGRLLMDTLAVQLAGHPV